MLFYSFMVKLCHFFIPSAFYLIRSYLFIHFDHFGPPYRLFCPGSALSPGVGPVGVRCHTAHMYIYPSRF